MTSFHLKYDDVTSFNIWSRICALGLAVDWRSDTLFWTDSELRYIMAAKVTGHFHRKHVENVGNAQGIVVDSTMNRYDHDQYGGVSLQQSPLTSFCSVL